MTTQLMLAVAAGGALGSVARYLVAVAADKLFGAAFLYGTLIVNVSRSFLTTRLSACSRADGLSEATRAFLTVGVCGGYTTFWAFSLDASYLFERGETMAMLTYIAGSVVLSIGALVAGLHLACVIS